MATVLITGGTGLIGKALSEWLLQKGYTVIILTRGGAAQHTAAATVAGLSYANWNPSAQTIDTGAIKKADYIVHLAGAGVADRRWSSKRKKEIVDSRTQGSALLVKALQENSNKVKAVISASAIGWYGADSGVSSFNGSSSTVPAVQADGRVNPHPFTETDPADTAFLGDTCRRWEESIEPVAQSGKRLVKLRTGIVLSKEGGALNEFMKPLRWGIAAILGNGKQIISWIHIDDLCRIYLQAIEDENMQGVYNAVAPKPVSNKELTLQLADQVKNKFYIPVHIPSPLLKLVLGEMSVEVLKSATVSAGKMKNTGFSFIYPSIEPALGQLINKK